jgi:LmbE family N-acetylglucosaminyl deacetylase
MRASFTLFAAYAVAMVVVGLPGLVPGQSSALHKPGPDNRFKADILVVIAHPDDETLIAGYLARAIFDQKKRVAVVYGTRGDAGGNVVGYEQAAALGAVREIEARRATASLGIANVWFIGGPDTAGQDVLRSLETWHHGSALEQTVRLVRLTRPDVILTWLPDYVVGENHGDHQAAAVIATEAFDMAGDPTAFPEQISAPRNRGAVGNLTEGLHPWQVKKIYYFSDTSHPDFLKGKGPEYSMTEVSAARGVPYSRLAAEEATYHLTQSGVGLAAKEALEKGNLKPLESPIQFILGKSLVRSAVTGDIFEGVASTAIPFTGVTGYRPEPRPELSIALGGSWAFYKDFWAAHGISHIAKLVEPEAATGGNGLLQIPILLINDSEVSHEVDLSVELPAGWSERLGSGRYLVEPGDSFPVSATVAAPSDHKKEWSEITWNAQTDGKSIGRIRLRVYNSTGGLPQ